MTLGQASRIGLAFRALTCLAAAAILFAFGQRGGQFAILALAAAGACLALASISLLHLRRAVQCLRRPTHTSGDMR